MYSLDSAAKHLTDFLLGLFSQSLEEILEVIAVKMDLCHISYVRFGSAAAIRRIIRNNFDVSGQLAKRYSVRIT